MLFCKIPKMHLELCIYICDGFFWQKFIIDIWHGLNAFELVDVPYYWDVWLNLIRIFDYYECFRKLMAKLIAFFEMWERKQPTIIYFASYLLIIRWSRVLKRKTLWTAEVVTLMSSVKRVFLKMLQYTLGK